MGGSEQQKIKTKNQGNRKKWAVGKSSKPKFNSFNSIKLKKFNKVNKSLKD